MEVLDENEEVVDQDVQWNIEEDALLEGNSLQNPTKGVYHLTAESGDVESSEVKLVLVEDETADKVVEAGELLLDCEPGECSFGEATYMLSLLFNTDNSLNEQIYGLAIMQLLNEGSDVDMNKYSEDESEALVWATANNIFDGIRYESISQGRGVSEIDLAVLAYNSQKQFGNLGDSNEYEKYLQEYEGIEELSSIEKEALNYAAYKGLLSEEEVETKSIDRNRIMSQEEVSDFVMKL